MTDRVHLGYEVGTGEPVEIPVAHMVVSGMTQQAGKTTALEALVSRSGRRAVTFVTKRGEKAFAGGRRMAPFFRERADWVFVASLIDATLGEKNKFLRSFLMKCCRGTKTLAEVHKNVRHAKENAKRGFDESVYTEIDGYLELVVPQLAELPPARKVTIGAGLNVMDLSAYSTELQSLVIKSVLEHVYEHETGVITVIPEAWEFLPEQRSSPVKREAETLIRKGAGLENFVWLDSQDLAGLWKLALRAAPVYLIGVQREANEIGRTLKNIPGSIKKPKAADIATLEVGQFFACFGTNAIKTYVQPAWAGDVTASLVACGGAPLPTFRALERVRDRVVNNMLDNAALTANPQLCIEEDFFMTAAAEQKLDKIIALLEKVLTAPRIVPDGPLPEGEIPLGPMRRAYTPSESLDNDALYQAIKNRLIAEAPGILKVLATKPEIVVDWKVETIMVDGKTAEGRVAMLIADGYLDGERGANTVLAEVNKRGGDFERITIYNALEGLVGRGFLYRQKKADRSVVYKTVDGMAANVSRT